jgi:hypothetical protein
MTVNRGDDFSGQRLQPFRGYRCVLAVAVGALIEATNVVQERG